MISSSCLPSSSSSASSTGVMQMKQSHISHGHSIAIPFKRNSSCSVNSNSSSGSSSSSFLSQQPPPPPKRSEKTKLSFRHS
jgi:hypothetical protein